MADDESEPKSINQILREHTGSRLYVHPIAWTKAHARLLKVQFSKENASKQIKSTKRKGKAGADLGLAELSIGDKDAMAKAVEGLSSSNQRVQMSSITKILGADGLKLQQSTRLPFRFDKSIVDKLCTNGIYSTETSDTSVVYVSFKTIQKLRDRYSGRSNSPTENSSATVPAKTNASKKSASSEVATDPYISAIMVSMAQEMRLQKARSKSAHNEGGLKTHVIALPEPSATQILLYTATFSPNELLYHLDYPNEPGDWDPVSISWSTIGLRDAERVATRLSRYIQKTILSSK